MAPTPVPKRRGPRLRSVVIGAVLGAAAAGCALVVGVDFGDAQLSSGEADEAGAGSSGTAIPTATPTTSSPSKPPGALPDGGCPAAAPTVCNGSCVDTKTSLQHCGGCNRPCTSADGGGATCVGGTCQVGCPAGFADCTNTPPKSCAPLPKWFVDNDGDGWGAAQYVQACTQPPGHVAKSGDCLDSNASVHPGAGPSGLPFAGASGLSFDYDCDGVETEQDAGFILGGGHWAGSCGVNCDGSGFESVLPARTGPGVDNFCGSNLFHFCLNFNTCSGGTPIDAGPVPCQ